MKRMLSRDKIDDRPFTAEDAEHRLDRVAMKYKKQCRIITIVTVLVLLATAAVLTVGLVDTTLMQLERSELSQELITIK